MPSNFRPGLTVMKHGKFRFLRWRWRLRDCSYGTSKSRKKQIVGASGRGQVTSGQNRFGSWFETNPKLLHGVCYWPYIYTEWLSKYSIRWCCQPVQELQKQCPPTFPKGKTLTCPNFLPACEKSFLTRKEYAYIWRLPHQIATYRKIPKISLSKYKPPKLVMQKTLR